MRDSARWIRWLVPASLQTRVFDPAIDDAARERRVRRRRSRGAARAGVELLFILRAIGAAAECRAMAAEPWRPFMIRQDITFALRMLRRAPGFTFAAVLAIALGIGANTAIFTVVKQVLLQPLPFPDAERIVDVNEYNRGTATAVSPPNFMDWRAQNQTLEAIAAYNEQVVTLSGDAEPSRIAAAIVDDRFASVMGMPPLLGRSLNADDMHLGARQVVVLSHGVWQRAFGGDRGILSRQITLEGEPTEVVGVMPAGFDFPNGSDAWLPLRFSERNLLDRQRGAHYLGAVARLRPGVTADQATQDLDRIEQAIAARFPDRVGGYSVRAVPLLDWMTESVQRPLLILFGAVAFVLLIACVNVSNLLLARATTRTGEIAVRSALGAGRRQLVRQLLAESVVLSLLGGAAGLMLATWGVRVLMSVAPADLPRAGSVHIDTGILMFSVLLSVVAGVLFGTAPAVIASRPDLTVFLRDAGRDSNSPGTRRRLRGALIMAQVALALVLLAGAGLAIRSFSRLMSVDPGFRTANVLTFTLNLPEATYPTMAAQAQFFSEYLERVRALPGVAAAGAVSMAPVTRSGFGGSFTIYDRPADADEGNAQIRSATPGYMEAVSIPLRAGRLFSEHDTGNGVRVAIISESTAQRYWPGENPVGRQLRLHVNEAITAPREIIGVVDDVRTNGLDRAPVPVVYTPHSQYGPESMSVMVRAVGDPIALVPSLKSALQTVGKGVAFGRVQSMDDLVAANVAEPRFRTLLLTIFAVVSLALAALGLYGVVAFSVNERRAELGLRIALGADPGGVLRLVLREGMIPVVAGILIGLAGAATLAGVMKTLLFGVEPLDPLTFSVVAAALLLVGLAACYVPARRATQVDPATTLR